MSDPFCEVAFNGVVIGKTKTRENTLNPFWVNEQFQLDFLEGSTNTLTIMVWDEDNKAKSDFLGMCSFSNTELQIFQEGKKLTKTLGADPGLSREANKLAQGTLSVAFVSPPPEVLEEESEDESGNPYSGSAVEVELNIISAQHLAKADSNGLSDPIAVLRFSGEEIGRTKVVDNDLNPVWKKVFKFTILEKHKKKDLAVSIYDMDSNIQGEL